MNSVVVIPARMASTRLPGKPLADIHGRPMIAWVIELAKAANAGPVLVAAAEEEVAEAALKAGAHVTLTDPDLPSGSDRVHAALEAFDPERRFDVAVNLQGDMPTMRAADVARAVAALRPGADIATLVSPSRDEGERSNPNIVKAIRAADGRCLAFTRAPAPWGEGPIERHVGIYVYRRAALARFVAAPPSPLELREKLEQLRALEMGMIITADAIEDFPKGVDSPPDLEAARATLAGR
ncbi:MAG TPA: 3-deoxy-manno-octulosonate cytidylyltransferase [Vitreimonas sp.]|uniref:3-deoxy-manno-octulosonate cytidylyltransferase n=1 Tax=Vitreimonas sp. TaxID=3069702 RepID=UPI002D3918E4|nr:3-deoxy-manno-octulosonate cytidylyltransferase [Vitreimonas sp.]HYD86620.1 3-deoxy-manno-octulosonate cytidylyltransferase [Vitreimonas sp.]